MCGIVGYIGTREATEILMSGLERLEYRGYDSAGIATIWEGNLHFVKAEGKLRNLQEKLKQNSNPSQIGIGHTRWATHGKPEERNAHPHIDNNNKVGVVQNGIVENYQEIAEELTKAGYQFYSETDTEVIPNLIAKHLAAETDPNPSSYETPLLKAVQKAIADLEGAFALAIVAADYPDEIILVRQQAPLIIGFGLGEFFCGSDITAFLPYTRAVLNLENGEMARLTPLGVEIYNFAGERLKKAPKTLNVNPILAEKQGYRHFMLKEIHEQPGVVRSCLRSYINRDWLEKENPDFSPVNLDLSESLIAGIDRIQILACGTSWHASLVGRYLIEQLAGIPTQVQYASEFRYAPSPITPNTLTIGVTQSGETADTLAALEKEKERRSNQDPQFQARILGITNRPESSIAQVTPNIIDTQAGIEIGVAATKTFVTQLIAFYCLAIELAYRRQNIPNSRIAEIINGLFALPNQIETILETQEDYSEELAHEFIETQDFIFIGRGINFPIALEGALKLKEVSYIHAEGYPAGELKHGPIALLDAKVPVVAIAQPGLVYEKVISNAREAKARDARLIGVLPASDSNGSKVFDDLFAIPEVEEILSPILSVIPLQLLAYHIAARRGLDVDQPRNLAKSVTVE
ncbi:MAG: glutamine--fructose-6-phosphate transaminase (isomerizing) [Prochloraceae cyanobacterium]|nr:glutamine--fructose-6-phosphate transaminase (isomerizing) [Prochloraceae cyanobacterium]